MSTEENTGIIKVALYRQCKNLMYERLLPMGTPQDPVAAFVLADKLEKHIMIVVTCDSEYDQSAVKDEIKREAVIAHDVFCLGGDLCRSLLSVVTNAKKNIIIFFEDHSESVRTGRTAEHAITIGSPAKKSLEGSTNAGGADNTNTATAATVAEAIVVPLPDTPATIKLEDEELTHAEGDHLIAYNERLAAAVEASSCTDDEGSASGSSAGAV